MSALVAVAGSHRIAVLTDAAQLDARDGRVAALSDKQWTPVPGCVVAASGWVPSGKRFARLCIETCRTFDDVIDVAAELFADAVVAAEAIEVGIAVAGWSERRQQLELYAMWLATVAGHSRQHSRLGPLPAVVMGPAATAAGERFLARFSAEPGSFEPHAHGLALMAELRRQPYRFATADAPAVGGWVRVTLVDRSGAVRSGIVKRWPDRIGWPVEQDGGAVPARGQSHRFKE